MVKRMIVYIIGVLLLVLGVFFTTSSALGIGPINTLPLVLSKIFNVTLGTALMVVYLGYIVLQVIIVKKLNIKMILQIPFAYLFGKLVDVSFVLIPLTPNHLMEQFVFLMIGILFLGIGVYLTVNMHLIMNPPDGAVHVLSVHLKKDFGEIKVIVDIINVIASTTISLLVLKEIVGVHVGTIIISLLTGRVATLMGKFFNDYIRKM